MDVLTIMLTKRGYKPISAESATEPAYAIWYNGDKSVYVCKHIHCKITIGIFREFVAYLESVKSEHGIMVYTADITTNVREIVKLDGPPLIELFCTTELLFDITQHFLQPTFELVPPTEAKAILTRYGVAGIPILLRTDPICRFYNWPRHSLIKITPHDDRSVGYRIV